MQASNNSEVSRFVQQITAEYEAARNALTGMATGAARHQFITARMEHMGALQHELAAKIGDDAEAMTLMIQALEGGQ